MAQPVTQQDTQPPAETLAISRIKDMAITLRNSVVTFGGVTQENLHTRAADALDDYHAALTRRAGGDAPMAENAAYRSDVRWWTEIASGKGYDSVEAALHAAPRAGGDAREWPDIGEDPMKGTPYEDRMAVSAAALRKAYTVQQPIVPDQTALVWRWHIAALLEAEIRLRSILARDDYAGDPDGDEPVDAGGDAIPAGEVEAFRRGAEAMQRKLADALRDHLNSRAAAIANAVAIPEYQA